MRLLLDTHVVLAIVDGNMTERFPAISEVLLDLTASGFVSVASLWEIAIKTRLEKLAPSLPLQEIPAFLQSAGLRIISIDIAHVLTAADPVPATRDPFDRLLLAQCQVEEFQLATVDRALVKHRLALKI
jgi:PIN domain nuclease of toxin-antitoxin system